MIERNIILASASPRRKELLDQIGLKYQIIPSNDPEIFEDGMTVEDTVKTLANQKAIAVSKTLRGDFLVIAADTVVVCNKIIGKPQDENHALEMLKELRNTWHEVATGIVILDTRDNKIESFCEVTRVKMRDYSDEEILAYIKTGEPMDKAGSYGIQGLGALLVERIEGCYFNVVGLPINRIGIVLKKFDVSVL